MLARSGEITAPCPVPLSLTVTTPSSRTPALSHLRIKRMMRGEQTDVGVQNEVHFPAGDSDAERVKRVVRASPRPKPVREPKEVFLVDRVQQRRRGSLNNLVLQSCDSERPLPS